MHSFWKKRLPAMLLAVLLAVSTMPAAMALNVQTKDITLVVTDEGIVGRRIAEEINDAYDNEFDRDMYYVEFEKPSDDDYGTLYQDSDETRLKTHRGYYYRSDEYGGDYPLSDLYFVPERRSGEYVVDYVAYGRNSTLEGTLIITDEKVDGPSSHKGTDFEYQVKAGEAVAIDAEDFANVYERKFRDELLWVDFSTKDTLSASNGMVYYDYDGRNETAFDEYDLDDYDFYYESHKDGDYPLDDLSFVAGKKAGTITLSYDACGDEGTVSGTVKFTITGKAPTPTAKGDIVYKVRPGEEVAFDSNDFYDFFEDNYDGSRNHSVRWVEFSTRERLDRATGYLYNNYGGRDEEAFDEDDLADLDFYYDDEYYGDYALDDLSFVAGKDFKKELRLDFTAFYGKNDSVEGTLVIVPVKGGSSDDRIEYKAAPGREVRFNKGDFYDYFEDVYEGDGTLRWVDFSTRDSLSKSVGYLYVNYGTRDEVRFDEDDLDDYDFYYKNRGDGDYALSELSFTAGTGFTKAITLNFTAYADNRDSVEGTVVISPVKSSDGKPDITYKAAPGKETGFNPGDFYNFLQEELGSRSELRWVEFSSNSVMNKSVGQLYDNYGQKNGAWFDVSDLPYHQFYYKSSRYGDYALADLSFVAGPSFTKAVTLNFTAYASEDDYAEGILTIVPEEVKVPAAQADILYQTTYNTNVQINANDIARYMKKVYPGSELISVRLDGVPAAGGLYYNYYGASQYGGSKTQLNANNCQNFLFKFSPVSKAEYALTELTYVPSGFNYCATIPFTAFGTGSRTLRGSIFISISQKSVVSEVYGITAQGAAVMFPGAAISYAVTNASGFAPDSIRFLSLPNAAVGTMYEQSGSTVKASTETKYSYTSGKLVSQLRFAPAVGFTGSVEIPYVAYNQAGSAIASGKFSLGVVSQVKTFTDVPASIWCYKYVTELTDAKVIDGYKDGTFKPNRNVTYGQALKLIMLAAGYAPQAPISGGHIFSGYLAAAQRDQLVTGKVNLDAPITRLAVAQIAAKAMHLDVTGLSSVKPFTDTSDPYVQALNAAGIVEGYFNNGTSTYKPDNNLTRGHISAIVWRIERAK